MKEGEDEEEEGREAVSGSDAGRRHAKRSGREKKRAEGRVGAKRRGREERRGARTKRRGRVMDVYTHKLSCGRQSPVSFRQAHAWFCTAWSWERARPSRSTSSS